MILTEFTTSMRKNSNYLFTGREGMENLTIYMAEMKQQYLEFMSDEKLMAEIDVPPEVSYTISYIQLIAFSGQGKNANCETRAQAIFPVQDVIANLRMADFCYPLKSALMFFLQHIYFDIEKDMNEDFQLSVWEVIEIIIEDLLKFVEVMQRSKRSAGGGGGGGGGRGTIDQEILAEMELGGSTVGAETLKALQVDVNKNFDFCTAFGKYKVSELMHKYVFEEVFPAVQAFLNLRLPMKEKERRLIRKLLQLLFLCVPYKAKPIDEKNISAMVRCMNQIAAIQELGGDRTTEQMGLSNDDGSQKVDSKVLHISQAQKLKFYTKQVRTDKQMQQQLAKEFEQLVKYIIFIESKTEEAFAGTNTIEQKLFIRSLIQSTDVSSDIPTELRTQSLRIIRKVIESENQTATDSAVKWDTGDWIAFKE